METGENPVRTRHCMQGVSVHKATGRPGRRPDMEICESGDLPVGDRGYPRPRVIGRMYTIMALVRPFTLMPSSPEGVFVFARQEQKNGEQMGNHRRDKEGQK